MISGSAGIVVWLAVEIVIAVVIILIIVAFYRRLKHIDRNTYEIEESMRAIEKIFMNDEKQEGECIPPDTSQEH